MKPKTLSVCEVSATSRAKESGDRSRALSNLWSRLLQPLRHGFCSLSVPHTDRFMRLIVARIMLVHTQTPNVSLSSRMKHSARQDLCRGACLPPLQTATRRHHLLHTIRHRETRDLTGWIMACAMQEPLADAANTLPFLWRRPSPCDTLIHCSPSVSSSSSDLLARSLITPGAYSLVLASRSRPIVNRGVIEEQYAIVALHLPSLRFFVHDPLLHIITISRTVRPTTTERCYRQSPSRWRHSRQWYPSR